MEPVERLYESDPMLFEVEATVRERAPWGDGEEVVLDRTVFFATSGGQPHDMGTLEGVRVVDVVRREDVVVHRLAGRLPPHVTAGTKVRGVVDAPRRLDAMRQHHGQHLLSAAFVEVAGTETASVHFGEQSSTITLTDSVDDAAVAAAVDRANAVVMEDRPVHVHRVAREDLGRFRLRREPGIDADVLRVVEVEGFDATPCSGTHPRSTGQVGAILVVGEIEKVKQGFRLTFLCGERALRDARRKDGVLSRLARTFSTKEARVEAAVEKLRSSEKDLRARLRRAEMAWAEAEAKWIHGGADPGVVARVLTGQVSEEFASELARALAGRGRKTALGFVVGERAHVVVAIPQGTATNAADVLRAALPSIEGRGGGGPIFAQGSGHRCNGLDECLARTRAALEESQR